MTFRSLSERPNIGMIKHDKNNVTHFFSFYLKVTLFRHDYILLNNLMSKHMRHSDFLKRLSKFIWAKDKIAKQRIARGVLF